VIAVPDRLSAGLPSPQLTVMLVGEFVVVKLTVTVWLMTAGLGESAVIVTVGVWVAWLTWMLAVPLLLLWAESPGYEAVTDAVPVLPFGLNVEVHVADAVVPLRVHVVNVPPVTPVSDRTTVPVGERNVPAVEVSVTVTVHVEV
jgi:hypothetical protein